MMSGIVMMLTDQHDAHRLQALDGFTIRHYFMLLEVEQSHRILGGGRGCFAGH